MGTRIQDYIAKIVPAWIDFRLLKELCAQVDRWVDDAVTCRSQAFLESQDGPLLDLTGRNSGDRRLRYRFPTPESDEQYLSYLRTRWTRHGEAGTQDALDYQVRRWGFKNYQWVDELSLRVAGYVGAFGNDADGLDAQGRPGPGSNFFALIIRPPHYFSQAEAWDVTAKPWDDPELWWDFGPVIGYPGVAPAAVLRELQVHIGDWRQSGASLRHIVVDFVGDCVVDNSTADGYAGSGYVVFPCWEPTELRVDGTYAPLYNLSWKIK